MTEPSVTVWESGRDVKNKLAAQVPQNAGGWMSEYQSALMSLHISYIIITLWISSKFCLFFILSVKPDQHLLSKCFLLAGSMVWNWLVELFSESDPPFSSIFIMFKGCCTRCWAGSVSQMKLMLKYSYVESIHNSTPFYKNNWKTVSSDYWVL